MLKVPFASVSAEFPPGVTATVAPALGRSVWLSRTCPPIVAGAGVDVGVGMGSVGTGSGVGVGACEIAIGVEAGDAVGAFARPPVASPWTSWRTWMERRA